MPTLNYLCPRCDGYFEAELGDSVCPECGEDATEYQAE